MVAFSVATTAFVFSMSPGCLGRSGVMYMWPAMASMLGPMSPMSALMSMPDMVLSFLWSWFCAWEGGGDRIAAPKGRVNAAAAHKCRTIFRMRAELEGLGNIDSEALRRFPLPSRINQVGGRDRDRTGDLIVANDALSQLSYSPTSSIEILAEG